jgi:hypothetical protein
MRRAIRITMLAVAVAALLSGCGPLDTSHWATGHFSGNKTIALTLGYGGNSFALAASVFADVADGTAGTVEVTGVQHWRCQGNFRTHQAEGGVFPWDIENLPGFEPPNSSDPVLNFFVPKGSYTVTVRIPAVHAELKKSASQSSDATLLPRFGLCTHRGHRGAAEGVHHPVFERHAADRQAPRQARPAEPR